MGKNIVFGGAGQLGSCLNNVAGHGNHSNLFFPDEAKADILNLESLEKLFEEEKPHFVINCAAYTAVDKAEDEVQLARLINKDGAQNLAALCKKHGAVLIHISTDFVFEGISVLPQNEEAPTNPISVYGLTKLEGELAIADTLDEYFIFRTSWLYSEYGNNFVKTMLKLGQEREELKVIADQFGSPTYAIDLANVIVNIIENNNTSYGLYHYSNLGIATWYDFAKAIFELSGTDVKVIPIPSADYVTNARRPEFSIMDKSKAENTLSLKIPQWHDSLKNCLEKINNPI